MRDSRTRWSAIVGATLVVAAVFGLLSAGAPVQEPPRGETPEIVTERMLLAMREGRHSDYVKDMHPEALATFRNALLSVVDSMAQRGQEKAMLSLFKDVASVEQLRALAPDEFFVAFLAQMSKLRPEIGAAARGLEIKIIGHVAESDDLVHVVYRGTTRVRQFTAEKMALATLQRTSDGWRAHLTGDMQSMVDQMRQSIER